MSRPPRGAWTVMFASVLVLLLLVEWLRGIEFATPAIRSLQADLIDVTLSKSTQIPIVTVLLVYFAFFLWIEVQRRSGIKRVPTGSRAGHKVVSTVFWKALSLADACKVGLVLLSFAACLPTWGSSGETGSSSNLRFGIDQTTNALVLQTGLVLSCATGLLMSRNADSGLDFGKIIVRVVLLFLAAASLIHPAAPYAYKYYDTMRWTGPWVNPNTYGLLMGTGIVLGTLQLVPGLAAGKPKRHWYPLLFTIPIALCGLGLFKSYSRGAWVATGVAISYLIFQISNASIVPGRRWASCVPWLNRNWKAVTVIGVAVGVMCFWQFRFTEWKPARRAFSIANINDFSWRNRVVAWKGAVEMMAGRSWFGYGWGQGESVYVKKYLPPNLENGAAIQMNDYLTLGVSAGVPALVCFLVYIALSLRRPKSTIQSPKSGVELPSLCSCALEGTGLREESEMDWPRTVCRAGAIALLVGFWFDGGLFKLATGSVFWILLALGRREASRLETPVPLQKRTEQALGAHVRKGSRMLKRVAGVVAALALIETIVLVATPFFPVSRATLAIARRWLLPPKAVGDLDFLATETAGFPDIRLRILLQHASLANYNRQLVNWSLDDKIYREYVLTPTIDPQHDGQLAWRRPFWEFFYPPIRHENDPQAAADIVMKFLRDRITVVPQRQLTIQEMWGQQKADMKGFEAVKIAAFRAVGIPARLNETGDTEIYSDTKWVTIPNNSEP